MTQEINVPELGENMTEGELVSWFKQAGDAVAKGDLIAEIETDKTIAEVLAPEDGILLELLVNAGDSIAVGEPVAILGQSSYVQPPAQQPVPPPFASAMSAQKTPSQKVVDFILDIQDAENGQYWVKAYGPTGEATIITTLPFDEKDLKIFLLEVGRPRQARHRGRVPQPLQQTVDFGQQLFDAVISGPIRDIFMQARHDASIHNYGLRLQLRLANAPALTDLPWEFMYDGRDFLALSQNTPVVRYLDLPNPPRHLKIDLPLRILLTISAPHDVPELNVEKEQEKLEDALQSLAQQGLVLVEVTPDAQIGTLQRALRQAKRQGKPFHIWHYIGHGGFDPQAGSSVLLMEDANQRAYAVGGFQLGTLFNSYPSLRLALLNACEGARPDRNDPFAGVAAALVERGVPAVIGMQFEITDQAAIQFSEEFYLALVDGLPVDGALAEARRSVFFMPNWVEWATPVLFMRSPDGQLFDVG